ncbi:NAD-dependent epimerase/dehydratase family protein [Pontibacter sp. KCTC 32443]|uniref:NAD-dependent epimerase/dehydratase family protein n=1 Tax=Pontibacter TaxID=323449 RepID=UPI00164D74AE|nr:MULTISPECIES: NAD-dependent epimerase/dehydratase family protein [Pontibacter]MBC5773013.1 NAD-dependent epimerase/dehydratase family protein [Pontibacter sp. KCTC 32443]
MSQNNYTLTGGSGFLGCTIKSHLSNKGHVVSLNRTGKDGIMVDISSAFILPVSFNPGIVIHAAGKAHMVPRTAAEEKEFFDVNFEGTKNLCSALELLSQKPKAFVFISTVAVYGQDVGNMITESYPLLGTTPYAKSKILAEEWLQNWAKEQNIKLAILRLPLIAGPNPPGNLGAMINGIRSGKYVGIGKSAARKSIVWAEDVAQIIPKVAEVGGIFNLTDGYHPSFKELEDCIAGLLRKRSPFHIPVPVAKTIAALGDIIGSRSPITSSKLQKMMSTLTFDDSKARELLDWKPSSVLDKLPTVL